MKRLLVLLFLTAGIALAEDTKLPRTTVMRSGSTLVTLKAGTLVKIVEQGDQTVTIKVNGKTGTIPWSALDEVESPPKIQRASASASRSLPTPDSVPVAAPAAPAEPPPPPRRAQTMYGKAVEKARDNAESHEKAMVQPTDEILDGK